MSYYPGDHAATAPARLTKAQIVVLNDLSGYDDEDLTFDLTRPMRPVTLYSLVNRGLAVWTDNGLHITGAGYDLLCEYV